MAQCDYRAQILWSELCWCSESTWPTVRHYLRLILYHWLLKSRGFYFIVLSLINPKNFFNLSSTSRLPRENSLRSTICMKTIDICLFFWGGGLSLLSAEKVSYDKVSLPNVTWSQNGRKNVLTEKETKEPERWICFLPTRVRFPLPQMILQV